MAYERRFKARPRSQKRLRWINRGQATSLALVAFYTFSMSPSGAREPAVVIGGILPLSGLEGQQIEDGMNIAAAFINRADGQHIRLVVKDSGNDPVQAGQMAKKEILEDGVSGFAATCCGAVAMTVNRIASQYGAIMVFTISSRDRPLVKGQGQFGYLTSHEMSIFERWPTRELQPEETHPPPPQFVAFFNAYKVRYGHYPSLAAFVGYRAVSVFPKVLHAKGAYDETSKQQHLLPAIPPQIEEIVECGCKCHPSSPLCRNSTGEATKPAYD